MEPFVKRKIVLFLLIILGFVANFGNAYSDHYNPYNPKEHEIDPKIPWPTTLTFSETKTNYSTCKKQQLIFFLQYQVVYHINFQCWEKRC